jgi:hypothetical protein
MRVEFRNFSVGSGQVWVHDGAQIAGPYTGRGPFDDGHFWSGSIGAESVIVEYQPDLNSGEPTPDAPPFEILNVAHQAFSAARPNGLQDTDAGAKDTADYCHLDPNCYPDWQPAMKMVGQLTFEDGGEEFVCTGTLVATRDNSMKPYLLTAGHCVNNEAAARTVQVYWRYQTASCGATPPASRDTSEKSTLGAHLIDYGTIAQGDYSLLLLQDVPADVTFSGWDPSDPPVQGQLTGIHHPAGSWKRISFGQRTGDATVVVEGQTAPGNEYLEVLWNQGRIEPGSSGSAVFTSPGVIVGTLTYGPASPVLTACEISPFVAGYGRFSNTYQHLQPYLENLPSANVSAAPSSLNFSITSSAAPGPQSVKLTTQSNGQVPLKVRSDAPWIVVSSVPGQISSSASVSLQVSVDPTQVPEPGQYLGTITILTGAAAPQFVNVTATVAPPQSNVSASITPATVSASAGAYSFTMQLAESAGVATTLTSVKINGVDYSSNIAAWFGAARIPAKGAVKASLHASGVAPGLQFFEFSGTDDSGQQWYRVVSAMFQ